MLDNGIKDKSLYMILLNMPFKDPTSFTTNH